LIRTTDSGRKESEVPTGIRGNAAWGMPLWRDGEHLMPMERLDRPAFNEKS